MGFFLRLMLGILLYLLLEQVACFFVSMALEAEVHVAAGHCFIKINLVSIEIGAVNASKLGDLLAVLIKGETAAAAHAGTIYHDGVHGSDAGDSGGLGCKNNELHHYERSDGDNFIKGLTCGEHLVERYAYVAGGAVGAVIGHDIELIGACPELVLKDEQILGAEADNAGDLAAHLMELLGDGECDSAAYAAADDADVLEAFEMGGYAQRTYKVMDIIADHLMVELLCGCADDLEDDADGAGFTIVMRNGQGDTLAVFINAKDDELTGFCLCRNEGCFDIEHRYGGVEFFSCYNFVHFCNSFQQIASTGPRGTIDYCNT